jgi:hypothetical protein
MMERRGSISPKMRRAGERFRELLERAQEHPLKACDLDRPKVDRTIGFAAIGGIASGTVRAREVVWGAVLHVGGPSSSAGSVLWHVVGCGASIKQWAAEHERSQETASGILIAVLDALSRYLDEERQ